MNNNFLDDEISKLADNLIKKPDEFSSEQEHLCSVCQNQLKIHIGRYQRGALKMLGITIECDVCDQAIAEDFIQER